jgi:putative ATP-binding cassette transporter
MLLGNLRSQLCYPNRTCAATDAELLDLLRRVNLADLAERCGGLDTELDWQKLLSIGEQQRLAFARLLLTRPRFAILDEATSALDGINEANLYRQLSGSGATLVSVSHRAALLQYHDQVLALGDDTGWQTCPATDFRFDH